MYGVVWTEESIPKQWRQGLIVSLYKKGKAEDPGNYRGITLLNVVGKLFCKILNTKGKFSEYQLTRKETLPTFRLDALVFFRAKVKLDANTCY